MSRATITPDLTALARAVARKYGMSVLPFDPECIHALVTSKRDGLRRCERYKHDPLLDADCRECPAWEPPGEDEGRRS
jgi:hypothetical protein